MATLELPNFGGILPAILRTIKSRLVVCGLGPGLKGTGGNSALKVIKGPRLLSDGGYIMLNKPSFHALFGNDA
jgi:hypothetical protein